MRGPGGGVCGGGVPARVPGAGASPVPSGGGNGHGRLAWRRERRPWRLTALFFLLSGALAGLLLAMGLAAGSPEALLSRVYHADVSWPVLLGSAIGFGLLLHLVFRQGRGMKEEN